MSVIRFMSVIVLLLLASVSLAQEVAPDFTLKSNSGENLRLAEQRGKVVMLNFWATWCAPCRKEMPLLDDLYNRYNAAGFELYGVNVEPESEPADKMAGEMGLSFPILYDTDSKVSRLYSVDAMPTTVVIDRDGNIRYVNRGYRDGDEEKYREQIRELIRE